MNDAVRVDLLTDFEHETYNEWVRGGGREEYAAYNRKTTICVLTLKSGFEITGTSGCEDPFKFDVVLGKTYALKNALEKLGEFAAFYRAQMKLEPASTTIGGDSLLTKDEVKRMINQAIMSHIIFKHS